MKKMTDYSDVNVLRKDTQIRKGGFKLSIKNNEHH